MIILTLLLLWNITPHIVLWKLDIPARQKRKASLSFLSATWRGLPVIPASLLAPVIVPIALLFTKWESEEMPWLFRFWDNDLAFNGDPRKYDGSTFKPVPLEDSEEVREGCYWLKGHHPRSFLARYVWMGFRNRASLGATWLGKSYKDVVRNYWGDPLTENGHPGWVLTERGGDYQLYMIKKFGPFAYRFNWGFKVGQNRNGKIMPINISASFKRWKDQ